MPPPPPSKSLPYLVSERQELFGSGDPSSWSGAMGITKKKSGFTITEAQELRYIKEFAPVTGKVGFSRTCYNFCWAGGVWPRCMWRMVVGNGTAMEPKWSNGWSVEFWGHPEGHEQKLFRVLDHGSDIKPKTSKLWLR